MASRAKNSVPHFPHPCFPSTPARQVQSTRENRETAAEDKSQFEAIQTLLNTQVRTMTYCTHRQTVCINYSQPAHGSHSLEKGERVDNQMLCMHVSQLNENHGAPARGKGACHHRTPKHCEFCHSHCVSLCFCLHLSTHAHTHEGVAEGSIRSYGGIGLSEWRRCGIRELTINSALSRACALSLLGNDLEPLGRSRNCDRTFGSFSVRVRPGRTYAQPQFPTLWGTQPPHLPPSFPPSLPPSVMPPLSPSLQPSSFSLSSVSLFTLKGALTLVAMLDAQRATSLSEEKEKMAADMEDGQHPLLEHMDHVVGRLRQVSPKTLHPQASSLMPKRLDGRQAFPSASRVSLCCFCVLEQLLRSAPRIFLRLSLARKARRRVGVASKSKHFSLHLPSDMTVALL